MIDFIMWCMALFMSITIAMVVSWLVLSAIEMWLEFIDRLTK